MYRILAVIDPENTTGWAPSEAVWKNIIYQQQRGEIAIGSGGIFGNGLFGGRYYSVPNAHNDFILSWIAILPVLWVAAWCWACCSRWWSRPLPPVPAAKICWAATSVPASAVPDGSDRGERRHEPAPAAGHRRHPAVLFGGRSSVLMLYICVGLVLSVYSHNTKSLFG